MATLSLPRRGSNYDAQLGEFAAQIIRMAATIGFRVSSRGWAYLLEQQRLIDKSQFDRIVKLVNTCRTKGLLPIDFVAEEDARAFSGIEVPDTSSPEAYMRRFLEATLNAEGIYTPEWWDGETYYIQMVVEKIDLKTLFSPVCEEYHIPIATAKGWASMLMRADYARRFQEAEEDGLKCVLLYCGDHDPDGLRISEFLRSNLFDLMGIRWEDGTPGYDPSKLIIDRFGLNYDFIEENALTWIDNLITGSGGNLASPRHPNHHLEYVQTYLAEYGARKCEANALVAAPEQGRDLCRSVIERHLGGDALRRFATKRQAIVERFEEFRDRTGLQDAIEDALRIIDEEGEG